MHTSLLSWTAKRARVLWGGNLRLFLCGALAMLWLSPRVVRAQQTAMGSASVAGGCVTGIAVTNAGDGYVITPAVVLVGGGGTGAAACASLSSGHVSQIAIVQGGAGYTTPPTVVIAAPSRRPALSITGAGAPQVSVKGEPLTQVLVQWSGTLGAQADWQDGTNALMPSEAMLWQDPTLPDQATQRFYRALRGPCDLDTWLTHHPQVATAIRWQIQPANITNAYIAPDDSVKLVWSDWDAARKADLQTAYTRYCAWLTNGTPWVTTNDSGLSDAPTNIYVQWYNPPDSQETAESFSTNYMWTLYVNHVAFALALEITAQLPWSITTYNDSQLRLLLDSATMGWLSISSDRFYIGTSATGVSRGIRCIDNLPRTAYAPPRWVYQFLVGTNILGATRLETIGNMLQWMRRNLYHFYGADTFGTCKAVWQYAGYPPISRVIGGTVDGNYPNLGTNHYTAGCHGSVGFLQGVLRAANIPVRPIWVAGHELACFPTERLYLDHGDDPYNLNVRTSNVPILRVLIDEATYKAWFTNDLTANIADYSAPASTNIGRMTTIFPGLK